MCVCVSEACVLGAVVCATRLTTTSSTDVLRDFLSFYLPDKGQNSKPSINAIFKLKRKKRKRVEEHKKSPLTGLVGTFNVTHKKAQSGTGYHFDRLHF